MQDHKLKNLVTEAVILDREIREKTERLKALKDAIATEAESRAEEACATEGGGSSISFAGADGCVARVTVAGATLKSAIKGEGKDVEPIRAAAGRDFNWLFQTVLSFKPVPDFREQALARLGEKAAARLMKLCTHPGKTTVSFETKDAVVAD